MEKFEKQVQFLVDLYKSKNLSKAEVLSKKLIKENPRVAILYNILGLVLADQNKIDEAMSSYTKGIKVNPEFAMIYNNIGTLYRLKGDHINSEIYFKKSVSLNNKIAEPHNNLGNLYSILNRNDESMKSFKNAINTNPNFFWAHYNLGILNTSLGNFIDAQKNFQECLKYNPNFFPAHRSLSRVTTYKNNNEHLNVMKKIFSDAKIDENNKTDLGFALGKASEDIKDFGSAFNYYKKANDIKRNKIRFSLYDEQNNFDNIKKIFTKELFNKFENLGFKNSSPIFIVGMPRSGTTLIEQILSSHKEVFGLGELDLIPELFLKYNNSDPNALNLEKLGMEYINEVKIISNNSSKFTDKLPVNFKWIGFIKLILPNSKIVHCYRNPRDNCLSIFKNYFVKSQLNFAYNMKEIIEYYKLYKDLMNYWNLVLPKFVLNINYEEIVNNFEAEIMSLLKNCNLSWDKNSLEFYKNKRAIKTASDTQARKKIYKSSINSWRNFKKELEPFFKGFYD